MEPFSIPLLLPRCGNDNAVMLIKLNSSPKQAEKQQINTPIHRDCPFQPRMVDGYNDRRHSRLVQRRILNTHSFGGGRTYAGRRNRFGLITEIYVIASVKRGFSPTWPMFGTRTLRRSCPGVLGCLEIFAKILYVALRATAFRRIGGVDFLWTVWTRFFYFLLRSNFDEFLCLHTLLPTQKRLK